MNILILSCNTGEGHNSVARALKEQFDADGVACTIADALSFGFKGQSYIISNGHVFVYRHLPRLFGTVYRYEERHSKADSRSLIYRANINFADRLYRYIQENGFDVIICVHVFPAIAITEIKRRYHPSFRSYFVATDYTCSPGANQSKLDGYFIPHDKLIPEFVSCGIPREKLYPFGMPIRRAFYSHKSQSLARREMSLPEDRPVVLCMGGSMGAGPMKKLIPLLSEQLKNSACIVAVCGHNEKMLARLRSLQLKNVISVGYTTKVSEYMDSADLILTKAGGLSSSEAAAKALPIVYVDAVPGCETRNIEFFCQNHYAVAGHSAEEISALVTSLLADEAWRNATSSLLLSDFNAHSAALISRFLQSSAEPARP